MPRSSAMVGKDILLFVVGAAMGAVTTRTIIDTVVIPTSRPVCPDIAPIRQELGLAKREIERSHKEIAEARELLSKQSASLAEPSHLEAQIGSTPTTTAADVSSWRISAIEKFVPLSDEQRERLVRKFTNPGEQKDQPSETLEEILGADNARFYQDQVKAAFKRVEQQELEKDLVWTSRQLNLSSEQEESLRRAYQEVEVEIQKSADIHEAHTPREKMKAMVIENRKRQSLRGIRARSILSGEQYEAYLKSQAESAESDIEVFHDPSSEK